MSHRRRLFLGIRLPKSLRKQLSQYEDKWSALPAKWVEQENLHITLLFLGKMKNNQLKETVEVVHQIEDNHQPFSVSFNKVEYGPPGKKVPSLIWVTGKDCPPLSKLRKDLANTLHENRLYFSSHSHSFIPHITLARLKKWAWKRMDPLQKPEVDKEVNFQVSVDEFEVIESKLSRQGPQYITLEKVNLSS